MRRLTSRLPFPSPTLSSMKRSNFPSIRSLFSLPTRRLWRLPRLRPARKHQKGVPQDFVLIISLHYGGWTTHTGDQSMQLDTVKNDVRALLDQLGFQHDSSNGRRWYFLMDYDLNYEDSTKTTKPLPRTGLPTGDIILKTLQEAISNGGSGLIHYSGHCYSAAPGRSELERCSDRIIYKETEDSRKGPEAAYLVSCDGKRIYGRDFYRCFQNASKNAGASAITVILDTCKAEAFIENFTRLSIVYNADSIESPSKEPNLSGPPLDQLVVVTASRADEGAWTVNDCGVLTYFLIECLKKFPAPSATDVVNYLDVECRGQPDKKKRQRPRIWSRYPLDCPFRLLPPSPLGSMDYSMPSMRQS